MAWHISPMEIYGPGGHRCTVTPDGIRVQGARTHLGFWSDGGMPIAVLGAEGSPTGNQWEKRLVRRLCVSLALM